MNDHYQAYLLRLQRTDNAQWRIMLRDTQDGTTQYFASQRELFVFMWSLFRGMEAAESQQLPRDTGENK